MAVPNTTARDGLGKNPANVNGAWLISTRLERVEKHIVLLKVFQYSSPLSDDFVVETS
jgi:hypothetical protein